MKNSIYFFVLCLCGLLFFSGCSMMPEDEEIIRGSVSESEIFDDGELEEQKITDDLGITEDEEIIKEDEESMEDDEDGSSEVDVQIVP